MFIVQKTIERDIFRIQEGTGNAMSVWRASTARQSTLVLGTDALEGGVRREATKNHWLFLVFFLK